MVIDERELYRRGVLAVMVDSLELEPGEATRSWWCWRGAMAESAATGFAAAISPVAEASAIPDTRVGRGAFLLLVFGGVAIWDKPVQLPQGSNPGHDRNRCRSMLRVLRPIRAISG
jgi:hypothetical protein